MNKQLKNTSCFDRSKLQQQNLKQLMRLTLINILNAKGVIYTYYKNEREKMLNYKNIITINYEQAKQTKPDYQRKERTYGFENEDQEKYFLKGIEAVSFIYNFNYELTTHKKD